MFCGGQSEVCYYFESTVKCPEILYFVFKVAIKFSERVFLVDFVNKLF